MKPIVVYCKQPIAHLLYHGCLPGIFVNEPIQTDQKIIIYPVNDFGTKEKALFDKIKTTAIFSEDRFHAEETSPFFFQPKYCRNSAPANTTIKSDQMWQKIINNAVGTYKMQTGTPKWFLFGERTIYLSKAQKYEITHSHNLDIHYSYLTEKKRTG